MGCRRGGGRETSVFVSNTIIQFQGYSKKAFKETNQEVRKQELSFLLGTHRHDLLYITMKYHENISKGVQVTGWKER